MTQFIFAIVDSDFFTFMILVAVFAYVTRWALFEEKLTNGYWLGWLVALFFIVATSAMVNTSSEVAVATDTPQEVQLSFIQVAGSTLFGVLIAVGSAALSIGGRGTVLIRSLQASIYTASVVLFLFFFIIAGDGVQRMISIAALAFGISVLAMQIVRRQLRVSAAAPARPAQRPRPAPRGPSQTAADPTVLDGETKVLPSPGEPQTPPLGSRK